MEDNRKRLAVYAVAFSASVIVGYFVIGPAASHAVGGSQAATHARAFAFAGTLRSPMAMRRADVSMQADSENMPSRREAIRAAAAAAFAASTINVAPAAAAVPGCRDDASNCYSTSASGRNNMEAWGFPTGVSREGAITQLAEIVNAYPQEGQGGVDLGGWTCVDDQWKTEGYAKYEFRSGLGNFAKFFNGGKPFVDDLQFVAGSSSMEVFSSSRVGDSDLGVNANRLNFIIKQLRTKGWFVKDVKPLK